MWKHKSGLLSPALNVGSKLFRRSGSTASAGQGIQTSALPSASPADLQSSPTTGLAEPHQLAQFLLSQKKSSIIAGKGWEGLKIAFRILEKASKAFPPLEMVVSALIVAIDVIEKATDNIDDFSQMASQIEHLASLLSRYKLGSGEVPEGICDRIDGISRVIDAMLAHINAKLNASVVLRVIDGSKDAQEIVRCLRTISYLVQQFQLDMALATESKMHEIATKLEKMEEASALQNLKRVKDASYKSEDEKRCMPGTRVAILAGLLDWATDPDSPPVFWLSGMAGTGKSAITGSLAELLDGVGILGASFFCSRDAVERRNVKRIIPTLAHSLANCHPAYRTKLVAMLEKDPDIGHYGLKEQFAKLIVAPLISSNCNMVMVIDALDECEAPDSTRNLLAAFIRHAHLPIKILFSSRPEPQMRASLDDPESNRILRLHDVEEDVVMQDIHLYLENRFADLCRDRKLEDWPSQVDLQALLHLCGAFFIYASTVIEYISATGDPKWRLANLVASSRSTRTNRRYSRVDRLYTFIMENAFDGVEADERDVMRDILSAIILLYSPLPLAAIVSLLDRNIHPERELMGLHSVINIPSLPERPVSIFHASFADYMADEGRSSQFFVDPAVGHAFLATKSLQCMNRHLSHHIGHPLISQHISQSLTYSCIRWAAHLAAGLRTNLMVDLLQEFFSWHLLHWMEFLARIGRFEDALTSLRVASAVLQVWQPEIRTFAADIPLQKLIQDALEFIPYNFEIVKSDPAEIYRSALVWLPLSSVIRELYSYLYEIPRLKAGSMISWAACDHVLRHPDLVLHAEFSPDSARVVSATQDGTVRIWNAVIRETQLLLEGHADRVNSASFSPDGSQVVSASSDRTLRIWDAAAGWLMLVLKGHLHDVFSAAWSADGSQVVSASKDGSVRVWDAKTGNTKHILTGGSSQVRCAAFSADDSRIVSARCDGKVHIWNAATGLTEQILVGHSDEVNSAAFLGDGHLVVSASDDGTVRIWDALLGETKQILMHPVRVWSAAISRDGTRIVSASADHIVRIWNIETGQVEQVLKGHADEVNFASFSQDGSQIISASDDGAARIWSVQQRRLPPLHEVDDAGDGIDCVSDSPATIIDDRRSLQNHPVYVLSDDNSHIFNRVSGVDEVVCRIPAQYQDIVGHRLSVNGSTVSFALVSGRHVVVDLDPQLEKRTGSERKVTSRLLGLDRRPDGVSMLEDWDEIVSKSIADRKLALYGSYTARRW